MAARAQELCRAGEEAQGLSENGKSQECVSTLSYLCGMVLKTHGTGSAGLEGTQPAPRRPEEHRAHLEFREVLPQQVGVSWQGEFRMVPQSCPAAPPDPCYLNEPGGEILLLEP